jgi:hypothetical protein
MGNWSAHTDRSKLPPGATSVLKVAADAAPIWLASRAVTAATATAIRPTVRFLGMMLLGDWNPLILMDVVPWGVIDILRCSPTSVNMLFTYQDIVQVAVTKSRPRLTSGPRSLGSSRLR